ncbi:MAG: CoA-binding protein [Chloroflexota bacterium]|nr:CoA-binding protein [Chloroflexota bacterium]
MDIVQQLEQIFHPRGVAVIGASNKPGNLGGFFLRGFLQQGFDVDRLYVVHPSENDVFGVRAFPSVNDIPGDLDLAIVFSPRDAVLDIVNDCVSRSVRGVVICTSGFAENGLDGWRLQQEITRIARLNGTRIIGPNCLGIYCPESKLVNYAGIMPKEAGTVGMFSQSGSMTVSFPIAASGMGIYFNKVVSCGNECDLTAADFLEYFWRDSGIEIVVGYIEGVADGRRLFDIARRVSGEKPILLWKGGTSDAGRQSAVTHTGALAGSTRVWDAVFKQSGMVSIESEDELLDYLQGFYYLPLPRGNRVAVVSATGGLAVTIADACTAYGLEIVRLSDRTKRRLKSLVPAVGTCVENPIDLGMMSSFNLQITLDSLETLAKDEQVDMIIKTVGGSSPEMVSKEIEALKGFSKPIIYISDPAMRVTMEAPKPVKGVAIYTSGRRAAQVASKLVQYQRFRSGD